MNDIDYKEISHRYSDLWLSAFNELLDYYSSKSEELYNCPLCKTASYIDFEEELTEDVCRFCPWFLYELYESSGDDTPCEVWYKEQNLQGTIYLARENRDSNFIEKESDVKKLDKYI